MARKTFTDSDCTSPAAPVLIAPTASLGATAREQEARKGDGAYAGAVRKTGTKRVPYHAYDGRGKLLGQTSSVQAARALVEKAAADA